MKRLIALSLLEARQLDELRALLYAHGIEFSETPPSLISSGSIWVREHDFERSKELLEQESAAFAARAREAWQREWWEEHRASHVRWLLARLRANPGEMILALGLLAFFVWLLVFSPLLYLLRHFT
ncbi:MAG TPA: DUF6164 family protein [Burkholderiales bacterium]